MLRPGYTSLGLVVSLFLVLVVGTRPSEAQTGPASWAVAEARGAPTAAAAGEQSKSAEVNNWTVGVAGGFFEGTFIRFAVELGKGLDDAENLRILPIVSYGGNENINNLLYLKAGEIAAIVSTGGKPNDLFVKLKPEPGFHFLPIEFGPKLADYYLPCPLSHDDYPQLIPAGQMVDTLCMSAVLAVYNFPKGSDRARRLERFIQYYFERFDKLLQPSFHPKWRDVNLAAKVPGWNRYWLAADKLAAMQKEVAPTEATQNRDPSGQQLFQQFLRWQKQGGK